MNQLIPLMWGRNPSEESSAHRTSAFLPGCALTQSLASPRQTPPPAHPYVCIGNCWQSNGKSRSLITYEFSDGKGYGLW